MADTEERWEDMDKNGEKENEKNVNTSQPSLAGKEESVEPKENGELQLDLSDLQIETARKSTPKHQPVTARKKEVKRATFSETDTSAYTEEEPEEQAWKAYQKGMNRGQLHRRIVEGTKSRSVDALKSALADYFYGEQEAPEEHLELVLRGDEDNTYTMQLLGISEDVIERDEHAFDSAEKFLQTYKRLRHVRLFRAVRSGKTRTLESELEQYKGKQQQLKLWPINYGVCDINFDRNKQARDDNQSYDDLIIRGLLQEEYELFVEIFDRDMSEIDNNLSYHLLKVASYAKDQDEISEGRYNAIKEILQESLGFDEETLQSFEEENAVTTGVQTGEEAAEAASNHGTEFSQEDEVALTRTQQKMKEQKMLQEKQLDSDVEAAVIVLQMMRVKAALYYPINFIPDEGDVYDDQDKKEDMKTAVRECEDFLSDAKHAVLAGRDILKEQHQAERQRFQKRARSKERPSYNGKKGGMSRLKYRRDDRNNNMWTDRDSWEIEDTGKFKRFKKMLSNHDDVSAYVLRLRAVIEELYTDLAKCKQELEPLERSKPRRPLKMTRSTLSEVRRYMKPPRILHDIVQAMLLLLGEDEYTTEDWDTCKRLLNPSGHGSQQGLTRRLVAYSPKQVDPEIARRVQDLMDLIDFDEAVKTSPAAGAYYIWTMSSLEGTSKAMEGASPDRQREIFHLPPKRRKTRTRDRSPVKGGNSYGGYYNAHDSYAQKYNKGAAYNGHNY